MEDRELIELFTGIWEAQAALNQTVGVDTIALGKARSIVGREEARKWMLRYLDEVVNEAVECKENFYHKWWCAEVRECRVALCDPIDIAKIKVEIIDMLHFCISALHIYRPRFLKMWAGFFHTVGESPAIQSSEECYAELNRAIVYALHFRNPLSVLKRIIIIAQFCGMDLRSIADVYRRKHEANMQRVKDGYAVATKTEADNAAIEEAIR